VRITKYTVEGR